MENDLIATVETTEDFLPRNQEELDGFEENFLTQLPVYGPALGLTAAEITDLTAKITAHRAALTNLSAKKTDYSVALAEHALAETIAVAAIRLFARNARPKPAFTPDMRSAMRLSGPKRAFNFATAAPVLKNGKVSGNTVVFNWNKLRADGIEVWCKRGDETEFTKIDIDTSTPYVDNRPNKIPGQPETRVYRAMYFGKNGVFGQWSNELSITKPE